MSKDASLIDSFPFSSYLDSNYIPSDEEVVQIKTFLIQPREQLKQMKTEIAHFLAELSSVESKYDSLCHQFNTCASLITLPRRVPDDVLEEIFYQSLPADRNAPLDNKAAPLIFTRICRQWRQVAFASPRLWSTIHIRVLPKFHKWIIPSTDILSQERLPEKQDMLRATAASEWLKRSGDLPLHISFVTTGVVDQSSNHQVIDPYLSFIVPFSSRWKSLVLEGRAASFSRFFTLVAANLKSLEFLILDFDPTDQWDNPLLPQGFAPTWSSCGLLTSPSLRKLSIPRFIMMHPTDLSVDWAQLTHLEFGRIPGGWGDSTTSMSTTSEILHVSASLVSCRIKIAEWPNSGYIHSMKLPLLRHLSIEIEGYVLPFTEKLEVPGLREINLKFIESNVTGNDNVAGNNVNYKNCLPLFQPQQGTIQKLIVNMRYLDHESFLGILRKCPELISLTVSDSQPYSLPREILHITIDDQFLERISWNHGEVLCSELEEFICGYPAAFTTTGIIEFIKRKQDGNIPKLAKLKKVAIQPYNIEREVLVRELEPYISQGLTYDLGSDDIPGSDTPTYHPDESVVYGDSVARYANSWGL